MNFSFTSYLFMGTNFFSPQLTGCPIKYKLFYKKNILHHFTQFQTVQVFGPLPPLLAFRLTEFPQNREGYKKVKLHNREDNKKSCKNIYPCPQQRCGGMSVPLPIYYSSQGGQDKMDHWSNTQEEVNIKPKLGFSLQHPWHGQCRAFSHTDNWCNAPNLVQIANMH